MTGRPAGSPAGPRLNVSLRNPVPETASAAYGVRKQHAGGEHRTQ
ncbi:hypothetical protein L665_04006 [Ralstonia solanacearum SD54]|nr:hypothetical protein L665_04006 [Ralstonia solanacearum SD54]